MVMSGAQADTVNCPLICPWLTRVYDFVMAFGWAFEQPGLISEGAYNHNKKVLQ